MREESKEHKASVTRDAPALAKEAHEEEMTICHAAALALVRCYLMVPSALSAEECGADDLCLLIARG
jgi:hypothetical protein